MMSKSSENKARDSQDEANEKEMESYRDNFASSSHSAQPSVSAPAHFEETQKAQYEEAEKKAAEMDKKEKERVAEAQKGSETPIPVPVVVAKEGRIYHYSGQEDHTKLDYNKKLKKDGAPENK